MKYPKGKKYASNSDERETLFPAALDAENKFQENSK